MLPKGTIKMCPDSFRVQELVGAETPHPVPILEATSIRGWEGFPVTVFNLTKSGWSTEEALREVARQLEVKFEEISMYGLKDKHAHTAQLVGIPGQFQGKFSHPEICLGQSYGRKNPLKHGYHSGNRFEIVVFSEAETIDSQAEWIPNRFGKQRLGKQGSEAVGRLLLEGDYNGAAKFFRENDERVALDLECLREETGSWEKAILHERFSYFLGFAIVKWQSFLWNQLLEKLGSKAPAYLPMWNPGETSRLYADLWDPESVDLEAAKRLHVFDRPTGFEPKNLSAEKCFGGWLVKFDLPSGVYATVLLQEIFDLQEKHFALEA